ncbi:RNA-directed DNA polymerase, eukaryota [Tanacetum coccineum]
MESIDLFSIKALWGNVNFDHHVSSAIGNSGGILCVWDPNMFIREHVSPSDYFLAVMGTWSPTSTKLLVISIYAPQELMEKRDLWDYLCMMIDRWEGETVILGDFNEARMEQERFGSIFNTHGANAFNNFISKSDLFDLPMGGYSYTWSHKSATKMSKLDRFLISKGLMVRFPHLSGLCLDRHLSDHRPIIMFESSFDYGPTPFRDGNKEVLNKRSSLIKDLNDINSIDALDLSQKAKIHWSIEGDENSKYFHGILNSKRSQLSIQGILRYGDWITDPPKFPTRLNSNQVEDLERPISQEEIKKAVWDCVIHDFFSSGTFPPDHKKINAMIFKVDFKKAFDSVRWDYLDDILKSFSFRVKWRSWISGCLDSSMGSVLVNGSPTPKFHFYKGLKQGDPLSLFLFILVMESLHISFSRVIASGLFKGVNINNSLTLSHLFYADGLKINLHKSKLMGFGVNKDDVDSVATLVGCSTFYPPFHYLGVNVGASMSRLNSWKEVTAKISSRLSKWKLKTLSIGGRLTLLKSVLTAILIYHMSLYKVPVGILNDMESIRRNFFNGIEKSERKMVWIRLETILASKKNGGLGVSSFFSTNRSLLFKWIWHFLSQDSSLLSRFIQAIHGERGAINNKISSIKGSIWLDIVRDISSLKHKGIDLLAAAKRRLGNGENTLFWEDKWIGEVTLKTKYPRLFALEHHKSITVAAKMGQLSLDHSFRRLPRGGIKDEQYKDLRTTTSNVLLPNMHDRWFWSLNSTGEFLVSSVRNYIDEFLLPKAGTQTRWIKLIPIKLNITAWRVCLDKLPTRLNHSSRGLDIPTIICPLCNESVESTSHIFFSCQLSSQLMAKVCRWWELDYIPLNSYANWFFWLTNSRLSKLKKEILEGVCYVTWWLIWKFRNQCLFRASQPRRDCIFDDIVQMSYLWISNRCKSKFDWIS